MNILDYTSKCGWRIDRAEEHIRHNASYNKLPIESNKNSFFELGQKYNFKINVNDYHR